ncbi:altronate hydrolase [Chitinophaga terrae (ex Kim and Jung 2007)]|uniref:Altronate hydrolase n=1 Tax=Chitinophaga terrae (ex Kim and Jung 2007) TaxID=408074 RepID=A0A1H4G991_9BACT|nr:altronate dehydratase family protein [Chitinophaga terrae (ex Kim and Jung 2007)]GEP93176.1 altronate hydrolase [Chitinophaga terrae (ex Kim and Jung 2007)]SEB06134.1 altronate hydrolase [Chitinophaga terrae (ex Kim and Jung 2007)]
MKQTILSIQPADNVWVALQDIPAGTTLTIGAQTITTLQAIAAKHKVTATDIPKDGAITMYGVLVGLANEDLPAGTLITTKNIRHASGQFAVSENRKTNWTPPDVSAWRDRTFMGYHRTDGRVGTGNYWVIIPLVFCENRNVQLLHEVLTKQLGYQRQHPYENMLQGLLADFKAGKTTSTKDFTETVITPTRTFPNIDGIKLLTHTMGCGGTKDDARTLCGLLAGYITHPNVAGATVLSLGCQNAQIAMLKEEIEKRVPGFDRTVIYLEQQQAGSEKALMTMAIQQTFEGLSKANQQERKPAPLSKLCIGMECGGSDGFSGISANPAVGLVADKLIALGGSVILSEFPELCGVEQELSDRCINTTLAAKYVQLMRDYASSAEAVGSGFDSNPSAGNIRDGLITDAIKSAGAAKKGGSSPVTDVIDYPGRVQHPGLALLCTPGSDVESTTAEVGAGATVVLFTTGLGTPTGNPITPVIKLSTNSKLAARMPDIIDIDTGSIIEGSSTLEQMSDRLLELVIATASGTYKTKAQELGQDDFIPWKRGISL